MGPFKAAAALVFDAYQGLPGLQLLSPDWTRLVESMPGARFNQFPGWYRAYLASSECDPTNVWFIAAYRGDQLVAVCPLQFQSHRVPLLHPRYLGTLEGDELQLSDFAFAPVAENASLLYELTRWLRAQRTLRWDVLRLLKVSEDSSLGYAAKLRSPALTLAADYDTSAYFDTGGTYDDATRTMTSKMRSNLRRRTRLAANSAPLRFECYRRAMEVRSAFDSFLDIESSGWKGPSGSMSSIRCRPRVLAFYSEMVNEFTARNECVINLLWHGDHAIAGQLGLHLGRTLYILKVGYRDATPILAPGILLQDRTIRYACEHPEIDLLSMVNDPCWVRGFKPNTVKVRLHCVPNWSIQGLLAHLGMWLKRSWIVRASKSDAVTTKGG
jgi:CelD/BcsL family acetyltransferase involved in cellulose biosynthesis